MNSAVEYIPFKGQVYMLDGNELRYLRQARGDGESLEQSLERICIEVEEEERTIKPGYRLHEGFNSNTQIGKKF